MKTNTIKNQILTHEELKQLNEASRFTYKFPEVPGGCCVITENDKAIASANDPNDAETIIAALEAARAGIDHRMAVNVLGKVQRNVAFEWELNTRLLISLLKIITPNVTNEELRSDLVSKFTDVCDECLREIEETGEALSCTEFEDSQRIG